jgi:hypothetical protein
MKKLVLGALLAVASSAGCTTSTSESIVTATWTFHHLADHSVRSCPVGFNTATIVSQPTDDGTHRGVGTTIVDKFDCAAGSGTITLPDDNYLVWVQIENDSGSSVYTKSEQSFVDTSVGDSRIDVDILDDGGYFFLTWDLVDAVSHAPLSCAQAGVTASGSIETAASIAGSQSVLITDKFTCEDHFGTTGALLAGNYVVSVDALDSSNKALSSQSTVVTKSITAPDGLTDLGNIMIPIQ